VLVAVVEMRSMMVRRLVTGRPRQFMVVRVHAVLDTGSSWRFRAGSGIPRWAARFRVKTGELDRPGPEAIVVRGAGIGSDYQAVGVGKPALPIWSTRDGSPRRRTRRRRLRRWPSLSCADVVDAHRRWPAPTQRGSDRKSHDARPRGIELRAPLVSAVGVVADQLRQPHNRTCSFSRIPAQAGPWARRPCGRRSYA
jgi:hypothetical protein